MRLSLCEPVDAYAESTESIGQAIGAASNIYDSKIGDKMNRDLISYSESHPVYTNQDGVQVFACRIIAIFSKNDLPNWLPNAIGTHPRKKKPRPNK